MRADSLFASQPVGPPTTIVRASCYFAHPTTQEGSLLFMSSTPAGTLQQISVRVGSVVRAVVALPGFGEVGGLAWNPAAGSPFVFITDRVNLNIWRVDMTTTPPLARVWLGSDASALYRQVFTALGPIVFDKPNRMTFASNIPSALLVTEDTTALTALVAPGGVPNFGRAVWTGNTDPTATIGQLEPDATNTLLWVSSSGRRVGTFAFAGASFTPLPLTAVSPLPPSTVAVAAPAVTAAGFDPESKLYWFAGGGLVWIQDQDSRLATQLGGTLNRVGTQSGPGVLASFGLTSGGLSSQLGVVFLFNGNQLTQHRFVQPPLVPVSELAGFSTVEAAIIVSSPNLLGCAVHAPQPAANLNASLTFTVASPEALAAWGGSAATTATRLARVESAVWAAYRPAQSPTTFSPVVRVTVPYTVGPGRLPSQYRLAWWNDAGNEWEPYACNWSSLGSGNSHQTGQYFLICRIDSFRHTFRLNAVVWSDVPGDTDGWSGWHIATVVLICVLVLGLVGCCVCGACTVARLSLFGTSPRENQNPLGLPPLFGELSADSMTRQYTHRGE
jgi:hypothetical protein